MTGSEVDVKILTLNCWGLGLGISKNRNERMVDIGKYIANGNYNIVLLQEVWKVGNFQTIKSLVSAVLPFSHYFDNGIIGTGTCIFSNKRINEVTFHEFGLNGYPHKITHGDWFGGKGLGVCQIDYQGFNIHIFVSHYHATYDYNPLKDVYSGHRVVHSVESAQWIKLSASSADLTIYAGDLNAEPDSVPYRIVRDVTPLVDAWVEVNGCENGESSETPYNSYTAASSLKDSPGGRRIDYILYSGGPNVVAKATSCLLPLPEKIPGKQHSYSDHEAVTATISLSRSLPAGQLPMSGGEFSRRQAGRDPESRQSACREGVTILDESLRKGAIARIVYIVSAIFCLLLLISAFVPTGLASTEGMGIPLYVDLLLFLLRLCLIVAAAYLLLMAFIFNKKERRILRSTKASLELILGSHQGIKTPSTPSAEYSEL